MTVSRNTWLLLFTILFTTFIMHYCYSIQEPFDTSTSHTVDLPLNNTYDCRNFCNPRSICAITGEQCTADVDCMGCHGINIEQKQAKHDIVPGQDDAGKLLSVVHTQSTLTNDFTSRAFVYPDTKESPPHYFQGDDTWMNQFDSSMKIYQKRYNPDASSFLQKYPMATTLTGEFAYDGPLPANSTFASE